jgi:hypothetical protein
MVDATSLNRTGDDVEIADSTSILAVGVEWSYLAVYFGLAGW